MTKKDKKTLALIGIGAAAFFFFGRKVSTPATTTAVEDLMPGAPPVNVVPTAPTTDVVVDAPAGYGIFPITGTTKFFI